MPSGGVAELSHRRGSPLRGVMPGRSGSVGLALNAPVATALVAVFQTVNMWMIHLDVVEVLDLGRAAVRGQVSDALCDRLAKDRLHVSVQLIRAGEAFRH